jgi:sirohydrochlorin cobaltochelatase
MAGVATMTPRALVVFAHGSRDPAWCGPVEAVAQRIARAQPDWWVRTAYLELTEPDLPSVVRLWASGLEESAAQSNAINNIATNQAHMPAMWVFPLFFGVGKHAREDLPAIVEQLRQEWPNVRIELLPSAGTLDSVLDATAQAALDAAFGYDESQKQNSGF